MGDKFAVRHIDFDHCAQIINFRGPAEIVQIVEIVGAVLGHKLHIVILTGMTDQFHDAGPGGVDVGSDGGQTGVEPFPDGIGTHGIVSPLGVGGITGKQIWRSTGV